MRAIAPRLGDMSRELTVAEDQHQFLPLTMARVRHDDGTHSMYARYTLTPQERARIAMGGDIYVAFPEVTYPHSVSLRPEWADPVPVTDGTIVPDALPDLLRDWKAKRAALEAHEETGPGSLADEDLEPWNLKHEELTAALLEAEEALAALELPEG